MTTPSEPMAARPDNAPERGPENGERRLHPLSWLFVLLASLREFAIPLIAVLLFGRSGNETWELFGALGGLGLAAHAVVQYFSFRFRIGQDGLDIRSGVLERNLRHIPFRRIHDVTLHRSPLHRLFGVAEVRIESAGGAKPEARMRVLGLDDAQALEAVLRRRARDAGDSAAPTAADAEPLLALPTAEVVKLGLISNRGMVVVAAAFGLLAQSRPDGFGELTRAVVDPLMDFGERSLPGPLAWFFGALALFAAAVAVLRLLSVALALLQFHRFELRDLGDRLQVDGGLLTRIRGNVPPRRIQALTLRESLLHRWAARRSLRIDTAGSQAQNESARSLHDLVPLATPDFIDRLVRRLLPDAGWPDLDWRPLHPRAWRRLFMLPTLLTLLAIFGLTLRFGADALWGLALLPGWLLRARMLAARMRYTVDARLVAVREGWLSRHWRFAEIGKLQSVRLTRSPFDRRHGMATLWFDTAGAGAMAPPLRIRYLPEAEARRLLREVGARIAATRLKW